jgi:hypothetical protein
LWLRHPDNENPTTKVAITSTTVMDTSPHSSSDVPLTPVNSQAGITQIRTNSEGDAPRSKKTLSPTFRTSRKDSGCLQKGSGLSAMPCEKSQGEYCKHCRNSIGSLLILISAPMLRSSSKMKSPTSQLQRSQTKDSRPPLESMIKIGAYIHTIRGG